MPIEVENKIVDKIEEVNIELSEKEIAKNVVEKDIEDRIEALKLNKDNLSMPLEFIIESFVAMFKRSVVREKDILKKEYEVFITDRLHKLLYTEDMNEISQIALEQKYIEEKRAFLKKELNLYNPFNEIIEDLLNDEIFKSKLDLAIEKYLDVKKSYENPVYVTNTLSMQDLDYTVQTKNNVERKLIERQPLKRFYASVPCNNLYGNPNKTLFEVNGGILAENEEIAKQKLKKMLNENFKGVFFNEKDIIIKDFSLERN